MKLPPEVLIQEKTNEELENLVGDIIYGVPEKQELNVVIEPLDMLPCALKIFTINGKEAYASEFGESFSNGSCMGNGCNNEFRAFSKADRSIMRKYGITAQQFFEIGEKLEDKLYVYGCGCCS